MPVPKIWAEIRLSASNSMLRSPVPSRRFLLLRSIVCLLCGLAADLLPGRGAKTNLREENVPSGCLAGEKPAPAGPDRSLEPDGGAAHGTGLRLVEQIAAAHGGEAKFYAGAGTPFRCELWLPLTGGRP